MRGASVWTCGSHDFGVSHWQYMLCCCEAGAWFYLYIRIKYLLSGSKWEVSINAFSLIFCPLRSLTNRMLAGANPIWILFMLVAWACSKREIWSHFPGNIPPKYLQMTKHHLTSLLRKYCSMNKIKKKKTGVYKTATLFYVPPQSSFCWKIWTPTTQDSYMTLVHPPTTVPTAEVDMWPRPWHAGHSSTLTTAMDPQLDSTLAWAGTTPKSLSFPEIY